VEENEDDDRPGKKRRREGDDDDEDRPRRKKKKKKKKRSSFGLLSNLAMLGPSAFVGLGRTNLIRFGLGGLVLASVLGFFTVRESSFALNASAQPEEIALKALIARGRTGNSYLAVTQFELCHNFVFEKTRKGSWIGVWIPIVPAEDAKFDNQGKLMPQIVEAMFYSTNMGDEQELEDRLRRPKVQVYVNKFASLSWDARRLLQQSYPGTDLNRCLILQEGRSPIGWWVIFLLWAGSAVAVLATIVLFMAKVMAGRDD